MPVSPDDGALLAYEIVELVAAAELRMLQLITERLRKGMDSPRWAPDKLSELQVLRASLNRELQVLNTALASQVNDTINRAYRSGHATAITDLGTFGQRVRLPSARAKALEIIASDVTTRVTNLAPRVLRSVTDVYREAISSSAADVVLTPGTRRQATQEALDRLLGQGVTGFNDKSGRNWKLDTYTEMAVRTGAGQAQIEGHLDALAESDQDLVRIQPGPRACPICDRWAGLVLSQSTTPQTAVIEGDLQISGTVVEAKAAGVFHPNCRCTVGIYLPGFSTPPALRPDPRGYQLQQQQRYYERRIREAKRLEALALDDQAAKAARVKVRERQAKLRAHLKENPQLKRQSHREQIRAT